MARLKNWTYSEKKVLIENYNKLTIKELEALFPKRSRESINNKIKRLKRSGIIVEGKDTETIQRAYNQRSR
ncbi:MAG: hypothetical protein DRJ45_06840 [Thermoprotei archaeon]|nr:MAG: hypothetical protein DRJ45_06840 [Thermoprotei archaeon]